MGNATQTRRGPMTQPFYDTIQVPIVAGPQTVNFFGIPKGGAIAAVVKDYHHTNALMVGILPGNVVMTVEGYSLHVRELSTTGVRPTLVDIMAIQQGVIYIEIAQKPVQRILAAEIPDAGAALSYFSNITPAATEFHTNRGIASIHNIHKIRPYNIDPGEMIQVALTIPSAIAAVTDVTFTMWGTWSEAGL